MCLVACAFYKVVFLVCHRTVVRCMDEDDPSIHGKMCTWLPGAARVPLKVEFRVSAHPLTLNGPTRCHAFTHPSHVCRVTCRRDNGGGPRALQQVWDYRDRPLDATTKDQDIQVSGEWRMSYNVVN